MELIFSNRNGKMSERQRAHIEEKLGKLSRYLDQISSMKVEVSTEHRQSEGEVHRLQVTLVGEHGIILRADQSSADLYTAADMVQEVLQRQITRFKEKHWRRGRLRRRASEVVESSAEMNGTSRTVIADKDALSIGPSLLKVKEFELAPMYSDDAIEQMELLDHSFFVFRDADTARISIVYRRHDGNYGMIVPRNP